MKQTPDTNPLPPLDDETEAALCMSIQRFGVLVPIIRDQDANMLDRHHRAAIAKQLRAKAPKRTVEFPMIRMSVPR